MYALRCSNYARSSSTPWEDQKSSIQFIFCSFFDISKSKMAASKLIFSVWIWNAENVREDDTWLDSNSKFCSSLHLYFFKWAILGLFFLIFVSSIQLTVNVQYKYLLMTGFEPQTSGIGSNHYTNWATTYLYFFFFFSEKLFLQKSFEEFPNQSMGKTEIDGVDDKEEMEITDVSKLFMTTSGQSYKGSTIVKFVSRVVIWGIFKSGATLVNQVIKCQPWCTS